MTGAVVWFTGLPGSGRSTLARHVHARLLAERVNAVILDSDELRPILHADGYTALERDDLYHRLAFLAALLHRAFARDLPSRFAEV
jgi:adenylylsulfate kinase-like enzyme